jgi:hypothetical protein
MNEEIDEDLAEEPVHDENEPSFCFYDFKKWMENQNGQPSMVRPSSSQENWVGLHVFPKIAGGKKLVQKMTIEEGDAQELTKDFRTNGGQVVSVDQNYIVVEVNSGRFAIPKFMVKKSF